MSARICNYCRHHDNLGAGYHYCRRPLPREVVTGDQKYRDTRCHVERSRRGWIFNRDRCGPDGRYWEQQPLPPLASAHSAGVVGANEMRSAQRTPKPPPSYGMRGGSTVRVPVEAPQDWRD